MKTPTHVHNSFHFVVRSPLGAAAKLFAPEAERAWAGDHWNPEFLFPQPGGDVPGAVFTVQQGAQKSVWINTLFDVDGGRMQYVCFVPETHVSTIDVSLTPVDPATTSVVVSYTRTALDLRANQQVAALGESDREKGPHWRESIERHLYR